MSALLPEKKDTLKNASSIKACAYRHLEKEYHINQTNINEAMAKVTIKHESEISNLKDVVERPKVIIKEMENKINSIMEKDMTKPEEKDYMEKEIGNAGE